MITTPVAPRLPEAADLLDVIDGGGLRSVFQPVVDLVTGTVVAYEALARGPLGSPLHTPDVIFSTARAHGLLATSDDACRNAAFRGAIAQGLTELLTLFVDVEPEVMHRVESAMVVYGSAAGAGPVT